MCAGTAAGPAPAVPGRCWALGGGAGLVRDCLSRCARQAAAPTQLLEGEGPAATMLLERPGMVVSCHQ